MSKEVIMKVPSFSADYPKASIYVADLVRCKDCMYAKLFEERDGLCGHPSNNAWDIFDEFYCGRGVKHE